MRQVAAAAMALCAKAVVTLSLLSGTSRQLRITGSLLAVDLAAVPYMEPAHCPHHEDGLSGADSFNGEIGELLLLLHGRCCYNFALREQ